MNKIITAFFISSFVFLMADSLQAKEITVVYTGQTHAMLYTCSCPIEQDGGVARRATLIKELRKSASDLLLLDCGSFTAGGLMDEYTQEPKLDMQRSLVNIKAMDLMRYDAVCVSPDEFNFGKDFFLKVAKTSRPAFLSANLESDKVIPYIIKNIKGVKVAVIGLTGLSARQKAGVLKINEPKNIVELVRGLKRKGTGVIILLSTLGEQEDLKLVSEVSGIDVLFVGYRPSNEEPLAKIGSTFIFRPAWQGRKVSKLILEIKGGRLANCKNEEIVVSDKFADDPEILSILPSCYSDSNCKKEGFIGTCKNPGDLGAQCVFTKPHKINLRVISVKDCPVCNVEQVIKSLKRKFPGITAQYLYYPDPEAKKLFNSLAVQGLPVYVLWKEVAKEANFYSFKNDFVQVGDFYLLKPQRSGLSYFPNRKRKEGSLDLFFNICTKDAGKLLDVIKDFKPNLHFLAIEKDGEFEAKNGVPEVEEYLRSVCVQKYYPEKFWDYLTRRAKNINSSYWDDCISGVDLTKVKACAKGPEGANLLRKNISLNKELQIMFGPTYLVDNQEIFSSRGAPNKEELRKIIKK